MRVVPGELGQPDRIEQFGGALAAPAGRCRSFRLSPNAMFAATVRCGKRLPSCGTYPMRRRSGGRNVPGPSAIAEPIRTTPASARSKPARMRSSVVLPLPDGPRIAVSEPAGTSRSRPSSTWWRPKALASRVTASCGHVTIPGSAELLKNRPSTILGRAATAIITSANGAAWA